MSLVFVIKGHHGHEIETHDKLYIFTRAAAMPEEFFRCGEATNLVGRRNFRQKVAGTGSALTGCGGVDFNCCTSATTLLHSFGLRLVASGASGSAKQFNSSASNSRVTSAS